MLSRYLLLIILCFGHQIYAQDNNSLKRKARDYFLIGEKAFEQNNWLLSRMYFDSCIQIDPLHFEAHYNRAISRENLHDLEGAINDYGAMIYLDPTFTEALWSRGTLYYQIGHYELACEDFLSLLEIPEEETNAVYFSKRYPDNGVSGISTLETMQGQIYTYLGMISNKLQKYQLAIEYYNQAILLDSLNSDILVNRSQAYENLKMFNMAYDDLQKAILLNPQNTLAKYNLAGIQEMSRPGSNELIKTYNSILEDSPGFSEAYAKRGLAKLNSGDLQGALQDYDSAIHYDKKDPLKWLNRGIIHMKLGYFEHALNDLSKAINLKPDLESAYLNRGNTLMKVGKYEEAKNDYDIAIFYYPGFAMAYYNRGIAGYNLGLKEQACQDLQKASDLGFEEARNTLIRMCR